MRRSEGVAPSSVGQNERKASPLLRDVDYPNWFLWSINQFVVFDIGLSSVSTILPEPLPQRPSHLHRISFQLWKHE